MNLIVLPFMTTKSDGAFSLIVDEHATAKVWPPNRFVSVAKDGNQLALKWQGSTRLYEAQPRYQLQRRAGFGDGPWENLGAPTTDTSCTTVIQNDLAFYRVVLLSEY